MPLHMPHKNSLASIMWPEALYIDDNNANTDKYDDNNATAQLH